MAWQAELSRLSSMTSHIFKHWGPSLAVYTGSLTAVFLYISDWKVTNNKIPFYGKKFEDEGNL